MKLFVLNAIWNWKQQRWFDLNRWGSAQITLNAEKHIQIGQQPFQPKHVLFPITQFGKRHKFIGEKRRC